MILLLTSKILFQTLESGMLKYLAISFKKKKPLVAHLNGVQRALDKKLSPGLLKLEHKLKDKLDKVLKE